MKFNFVIIPIVIIATAYSGRKYLRAGLKNWYVNLHKPPWAPSARKVQEIRAFLFILTGFAVLWFWNVPAFTFWQYIVGAILLINAYLNVDWTKTFFFDHNFERSRPRLIGLLVTAGAASVIMFPISGFAAILMLPYLTWLYLKLKFAKEVGKGHK